MITKPLGQMLLPCYGSIAICRMLKLTAPFLYNILACSHCIQPRIILVRNGSGHHEFS